MANQTKKTQVESLVQLLNSAPNFALIKYEKTKHKALEELRHGLIEQESKIRVVKNTLLQKALQTQAKSKKELAELVKKIFPLTESTAVLTLDEDYAKGLKAFHTFAKKDTTVSFKIGILDNKMYLGADLQKIAVLPSKLELIAKLIGGLKSPSSKLVYAMKFNISKLTLVLKERAKQTN